MRYVKPHHHAFKSLLLIVLFFSMTKLWAIEDVAVEDNAGQVPAEEMAVQDDAGQVLAEEMAVEETDQANVEAAVEATQPSLKSQSCPVNFNQVPVPESGKLCQIFAADFPASMVLHVPQTPMSVVQFYQDTQLYGETQTVKDRYMMQTEDKNTTIIVSADGEGSQVDILVKRAQEN